MKKIVEDMSNAEPKFITDPDEEGRFTVRGNHQKDFEILFSHEFEVGVKMGLFAEIFYSPYLDEVLELYVASSDELVSDF